MLTLGLLVFTISASCNASCFEKISPIEKSINYYVTTDYSRCTIEELEGAKNNLDRFLLKRVKLMKREYRKKNSGDEQFRLLTEINAGKTSIQMINSELIKIKDE